MNKHDLIDAMMDGTDISRAAAERVLDGLLGAITSTVSNGGRVTISGFGTFERVERAARTVLSPRDRTPIEVPASSSVRFKPSKKLKDAVNSKEAVAA